MPHPWTCRRGGLGAGDSTARRLACEALSIFTPIDHAQQLCPHQLSGCLWEQDRAIALVAPAPSPSSNAATPASRGLDLENSLITISGANSLAVCLCRARILLPALGSRSLCAISTVVSLPALQQEPARPRKLRRTIKFASRRDTVQRPVTAGWKNEHERKSSQSDKGALSLLLFPGPCVRPTELRVACDRVPGILSAVCASPRRPHADNPAAHQYGEQAEAAHQFSSRLINVTITLKRSGQVPPASRK